MKFAMNDMMAERTELHSGFWILAQTMLIRSKRPTKHSRAYFSREAI